MNVNLSMRFTLLVVGAIVLAADPGLATLPAPVRIDAGLVSGVAGGTATMRVFKGIPLRRRLWVRCDGGRRSPLGVGLAFGWRTSSAHGACNRAVGWWAARRDVRRATDERGLFVSQRGPGPLRLRNGDR